MDLLFLDTHVVIWLYANYSDKLSLTAHNLIEQNDLYMSPASFLELQLLNEMQRLAVGANDLAADLYARIGLQLDQSIMADVAKSAIAINWTRDPFDRLIVANAALVQARLLTKDRIILTNYAAAIW